MLGQKSITVDGAEVGIEAILLGATTSIGGLLFGYDIGQISGLLLFEDFKRRFANHLNDGSFEWGLIWQSVLVSLMSIGGLLGALSGA
ncbi:putative glucose transporter rco-3 [Beauveria bassiana]|uniref:Putative glucose transporter rco-3 n=1 Tax=Beauveria bassiana TaxID=176275 RepID=A0A2N6NC27_BEABA|nr:putative glucose transporter rco-3 [Beauveria bassiana]